MLPLSLLLTSQINTAHELILTEVILENILGSFEPQEAVALLSAFVFSGKSDDEPILTPRLAEGKKLLIGIAERIEAAQTARRANTNESFSGALRFGLTEVVFEWARGMVRQFPCLSELTPTALCASRRADRGPRGHHRPRHLAPRRDLPRGPRCGARHRRRLALSEDGGRARAHPSGRDLCVGLRRPG